MKSVGLDGTGNGSQRMRLGCAPASSNGPETSVGCDIFLYGECIAEGRSRYIQVLWFSARGAVNAVPESTSGYSPFGVRWGEFCPTGSAPRTASLEKVFPN